MKNEFPDVRNMQIKVQENIDHFAIKWSIKMKAIDFANYITRYILQ